MGYYHYVERILAILKGIFMGKSTPSFIRNNCTILFVASNRAPSGNRKNSITLAIKLDIFCFKG